MPVVLAQVPFAAYVVDIVPVHASGGGVVHATPLHGSTHAPFSHSWFVIAQSISCGVYAHTPLPVELSQRPFGSYVCSTVPVHVEAGAVEHVVDAHGSFGATHAPDAQSWNVAVQSTRVWSYVQLAAVPSAAQVASP